jgi:hypothetical protein
MLAKLQIWLFSNGADKGFCVWDKLGNLVQDIRTLLGSK